MVRITNIVHNNEIGNLMFNLYDRWRDECEYEDINEYAKVIIDKLTSLFPQYNIKLVKPSKRPFGVIISINDEYSFRLYIKLKGNYAHFMADNKKTLM
jgi:hypothetical protein